MRKRQVNRMFVYRCYCGTGYIVKSSFYDILISNIREGLEGLMRTKNRDYSWDAYWVQLQKVHRFVMIHPLSIYQKPDYSDIEEQEVNYKSLMLSRNK